MSADPHAQAVLDVLETGFTVGDGEAKKNGGNVIAPQVVVHWLTGGARDGTAAVQDEWVDWRFQLTAVGRLAAEARDILDQADAALRTATFTVDEYAPGQLRRIGGVGVLRDDTLTPALFVATQLYGWWSFPA